MGEARPLIMPLEKLIDEEEALEEDEDEGALEWVDELDVEVVVGV